ncbi:AMP deaminase [Planoprotostelium fungivorum]|uniref:AMP deaminase n=1 Tax=Planoprotostelium fungivorum TaxID=1890364 RepID=A0A2P6NJH1_9EUKA|nr:AMP deaminase [Planoprotostelium fungivorum]
MVKPSTLYLETEVQMASRLLLDAHQRREKYLSKTTPDFAPSKDVTDVSQYKVGVKDGIIVALSHDGEPAYPMPVPFKDYVDDYNFLLLVAASGPTKSLTYQRLKFLEAKFNLHKLLNEKRETEGSQSDPKDFSNIVKVDTHIHLAAGMTAAHLLDYIKRKAANSPQDEVILNRDGTRQTLEQVFQKAKLRPSDLTINSLDVYADNTFQRFDNFNNKYNPFGFSELRTVFLKTDNFIKGRYFAEITAELIEQLKSSKTNKAEYRLSIYGRSVKEWDDLAKWTENHNLNSDVNRWIIQVPRVYDAFHKFGAFKSFHEMMNNIFEPLFRVTLDPESNPALDKFLAQVSGFDSVDDESKPEGKLNHESVPSTPEEWTQGTNPPYAYYMYYMWSNITSLNSLRKMKGLPTFDLRPHSGESGDIDHLAASYLLARGINHGINLDKSTPLQYLFYLSQIGLAVSPLSNNALFLDYKRNPFPLFFKRGLNVSLSTDDPLQFHLTQDPLLEEYAIAAKRWRFSSTDLSEIARNSVIQSGFTHEQKLNWLGPDYLHPGPSGNDVLYTNVPQVRYDYRCETLEEEFAELKRCSAQKVAISPVLIQLDYPRRVSTVSTREVEGAIRIQEAMQLRRRYESDYGKIVPQSKSDPTSTECIKFSEAHHLSASTASNFHRKVNVENARSHNTPRFDCVGCATMYCIDIRIRELTIEDLITLEDIRSDNTAIKLSQSRLEILELRYDMHGLLNGFIEKELLKKSQTDFLHVVKVDTQIHALSAPCAHHLLNFMKEKILHHPKDKVMEENGKMISLQTLFDRLNITLDHFTLDTLEMTATSNHQNNYSKSTASYDPLGHSDLRTVFLKKDNIQGGLYYGQLLSEVMKKTESQPSLKSEMRISIYGRSKTEWKDLARWMTTHVDLQSKSNRWYVQIPRLYNVFREQGDVPNFQELLDNIFEPLFKVTADASNDPQLANILDNCIAGFDSVDEELSNDDITAHTMHVLPINWVSRRNPPYNFYLYYMYANIHSLNHFRASRGLNTFTFKPHCGETGSVSHLSGGYLLSDGISHGLNLERSAVLEYLFFLSQLPLAMAPLSEDVRCIPYDKNPFGKFFKRGMNVSLSTDAPLQLHTTEEPLIEEYSAAAKMWKLSMCDLCEIAKNSVVQSGFSVDVKSDWLGPTFQEPGIRGNDINYSNIPNTRALFRHHSQLQELKMIDKVASFSKSKKKSTSPQLFHSVTLVGSTPSVEEQLRPFTHRSTPTEVKKSSPTPPKSSPIPSLPPVTDKTMMNKKKVTTFRHQLSFVKTKEHTGGLMTSHAGDITDTSLSQDFHHEAAVNLHDIEYIVRISVSNEALVIEIEEASTVETWKGQFPVKYIEEITQKTGNFKKFSVFVKMLVSALSGTSESVVIDILTYEDLERLKQKQTERSSSSSNTNRSSTAHSKRYLIMTYLVEFDRVHYPLPLVHQSLETSPSTAKALRDTIKKLRAEISTLRAAQDDSKEHRLIEVLTAERDVVVRERDVLKAKVQKLERDKEDLYDELDDEKNKRRRRREDSTLEHELDTWKRKCADLASQLDALRQSQSGRESGRRTTTEKPKTPRFDPTAYVREKQSKQARDEPRGSSVSRMSNGSNGNRNESERKKMYRTPSPQVQPRSRSASRKEPSYASLTNSASRKMVKDEPPRRQERSSSREPRTSARRAPSASSQSRMQSSTSSHNRPSSSSQTRHRTRSNSKEPERRRSRKIETSSDDDSDLEDMQRSRRRPTRDRNRDREPTKEELRDAMGRIFNNEEELSSKLSYFQKVLKHNR